MKNLNKIILVGLTAFWAACSNDAGAESGVSGATTEPSTSPMANLTDEQKVILTKSFKTLVDSAKYVLSSSDEIDDDGIWEPDSNYLEILRLTYPFDSKPEENFAYPSQNGRRKCNVSTYPADLGVVLKQSFNASASFSGPQKKTSSVISSKLVEMDGVPVIVKSVGTESSQNGYWGYGVSCSEYLNRFKQSCSESNGIFKDFGDGCRSLRLTMACSMFAPDGLTEDAVMDSFTEEYKNMCQDDSVKYASVENADDVIQACSGGGYVDMESSFYSTCPEPENNYDPVLDSLSVAWRIGLKRTFDAYREQFNVFKDTVDGTLHTYHYPELVFGDGVAYNSFPNGTDVVSAYREEGVYHLPDSLVEVFFPEAAQSPQVLEVLKRRNETYYIIVLKDIGAKGHILKSIGADEIRILDIVKSGESCTENNDVYYSVYLIKGSPEWDVSGKKIVRETYVSPLWKCDDQESLERIEPYGEWINQYGFV